MSISDFDPEILQDFLTESGELLEQLESDLVSIEATPDDLDLVNQIFRALHTIKGSASFLALTNLVEIAHAAETALNAARTGAISLGPPEMDLLLAAVDVLKVQFEQLGAGEVELEKADDRLVADLTNLGGQSPDGAAPHADPDATPGTPTEIGSDAGDDPEADAGCERVIELDPAKADLVEHLVSDVQQSISQMQMQLERLNDSGTRSATGTALSELAEDLVKTLDFFEIDECVRIASALERAFEGLDSLSEDQVVQVRHRALAACSVLGEQANELSDMRLTVRPTGTLIERLGLASNGDLPAQQFLAPDTDPRSVLAFDGVSAGAQGVPPAESPASDPDFNPPPAPATDSPSPEPKPELARKQAANAKPDPTAKRAQVPLEQTIRVEVGRLESLMNLVGELVLQKNRVGALADEVATDSRNADLIEQMEVTASTLDRVTGDIQVAVMRTRMQPLDKLFGKYPRLIRDLATKTGKQIQLVIEGGDTEVDKSVIEELGDPLVHLLRNSADHGIEMPGARADAGKDPKGTIRLVAGHEGSHVCLRIIDDGKGLNREVIGRKAVQNGLCSEEQLATLADEEVFRFILEAGFSTADQVSDLSGRGVGMDVVRTNIERNLKGSLTIESEPGAGTTLTITIPLTVAIMPAMMVAVGEDTFAIPLTNITEIVRPTPDMFSSIGDSPMIHLRGQVHPLMSAREIFDLADENDPEPFVVVIGFNQKLVGLRVSRVIGQQEIVIKPLDGVRREGPISGATVRNDGGVSLIVDIAELVRLSRSQHNTVA